MSALNHQEGGNHYAKLKIQPIEYIHANGIGFAEGNVIKYVTRWRDKNGIADLKKARHFLDLLIELEMREEKVTNLDDNMIGQVDPVIAENWQAFNQINTEWVQDKELPSSGIYGDDGYTEQDQQAASLVHDAEPLNPDLVALCANTTIHADEDGWRVHHGDKCPFSDGETKVEIMQYGLFGTRIDCAFRVDWGLSELDPYRVAKWRYAK